MLTKLRWRVANYFAGKAKRSIEKGGYKNIKIGMRYFKWSLMVVPSKSIRNNVCTRLRRTAEAYRHKYKDQA